MDITGLIVGLGNIGSEYDATRHNMGFSVLDALMDFCAQQRSPFVPFASPTKKALMWKGSLPGIDGTWLLLKPQTYMNLSGEAVQPVANYFRITPSQIIAIHDDLDLHPGRLKFKIGGGNAGHNGLKSLTQHLGTPDFYRLRFGIGRPESPDAVTRWVLGKSSPDDRLLIEKAMPAALETLLVYASRGSKAATQFANNVK